jgi:hypothetical protein
MGGLKSFGDMQDSLLKLKETFDEMMGRNQNFSPIKKKDLRLEYGNEKSCFKE